MEHEGNPGPKVTIEVNPLLAEFIDFLKDIKFGEIYKIQVQDGIPVYVETAFKRIRFGKKDQDQAE